MDLNPGEIICKECKGTGYDLKIPEQEYEQAYYIKHCKCSKCYGVGKLDWIEAVVGKKQDSYMWFTPTPGYRRGRINEIKTG